MKHIPQKTEKWERRKKYILSEWKKYDEQNRADYESRFAKGTFSPARFRKLMGNWYFGIAQEHWADGNATLYFENVGKSLDEHIEAIRIWKSGTVSALDSAILRFEEREQSGYLGWYAIALERYDDIPLVAAPSSLPYRLIFDTNSCTGQSGDPLSEMAYAVCKKDSERFEAALESRMKVIRKNSVDTLNCDDIFSIALIAQAHKIGMDFYCSYAEVDVVAQA